MKYKIEGIFDIGGKYVERERNKGGFWVERWLFVIDVMEDTGMMVGEVEGLVEFEGIGVWWFYLFVGFGLVLFG